MFSFLVCCSKYSILFSKDSICLSFTIIIACRLVTSERILVISFFTWIRSSTFSLSKLSQFLIPVMSSVEFCGIFFQFGINCRWITKYNVRHKSCDGKICIIFFQALQEQSKLHTLLSAQPPILLLIVRPFCSQCIYIYMHAVQLINSQDVDLQTHCT